MSQTLTLPPISPSPNHGSLSLRPVSRQLQIKQHLQQQQQQQQQRQQQQSINLPRRLPVIFLDPQRLTRENSRSEKFDPSLLLAPARKKLVTLESQRVMGVLMETLSRVNLVLALPRFISNLDRIANGLNRQDLVGLLEEHAALLDELDDLLLISGAASRASQSRGASAYSRIRTPAKICDTVGAELVDPKLISKQDDKCDGDFEEIKQNGKSDTDDQEMPFLEESAIQTEVQEGKEKLKNMNELTEDDALQEQEGGSESTENHESGFDQAHQSFQEIKEVDGVTIEDKANEQECSKSVKSESDAAVQKSEQVDVDQGQLREEQMNEEENEQNQEEFDDKSQDQHEIPDNTRPDSLMSKISQSLLFARLQDSCRNILRIVARQSDVVKEILRCLDDEDDERDTKGSEAARAALKDLRDVAMRKLLTSSYEQAQQGVQIEKLEQRIGESDEVNAKLEEELRVAEAERDNDIQEKNEIIRRLQTDLNRIERQSNERINHLKLEGARNQSAEQSACEERCSVLRQEKSQIQGQYNSLLVQHRESEMVLRKRKFQIETEIENLIQKYDNDMGEKQDEYDQIDFVYTEERRQLNELEERFRTLEVEYDAIAAARRAAREAREKAERELHRAVRAATAIQAFWRSHRVRKAMKSRKRRGGATGGKKKK